MLLFTEIDISLTQRRTLKEVSFIWDLGLWKIGVKADDKCKILAIYSESSQILGVITLSEFMAIYRRLISAYYVIQTRNRTSEINISAGWRLGLQNDECFLQKDTLNQKIKLNHSTIRRWKDVKKLVFAALRWKITKRYDLKKYLACNYVFHRKSVLYLP